jgi:hypothetical protein
VGHLAKPEAAELLDELHGAARADRSQFLRLLPRLAFGFARGRTFAQTITPEALKNAFIAVPREEGWFLHLTARAIGATGVVEFGTSFGISTIYLGAAVVDNGGGWVVGSELLPSKHQRAVANLKRAGLEQVVDVRLGDALETLRETPGPIDLVFLDGWKDLYLPVLKLLEPRLRVGSGRPYARTWSTCSRARTDSTRRPCRSRTASSTRSTAAGTPSGCGSVTASSR